MTTQPTLEQLARWREEAEDAYVDDDNTHFSNDPKVFILGYLRAKQENEQAIKYAHNLALEDALAIVKNETKPGDMEFEIKELLK